jgi:hypothetical protein
MAIVRRAIPVFQLANPIYAAHRVTFYLTHSADTLTLAGGALVLPAAGLQVGSSVPFSDSSGTRRAHARFGVVSRAIGNR